MTWPGDSTFDKWWPAEEEEEEEDAAAAVERGSEADDCTSQGCG